MSGERGGKMTLGRREENNKVMGGWKLVQGEGYGIKWVIWETGEGERGYMKGKGRGEK